MKGGCCMGMGPWCGPGGPGGPEGGPGGQGGPGGACTGSCMAARLEDRLEGRRSPFVFTGIAGGAGGLSGPARPASSAC